MVQYHCFSSKFLIVLWFVGVKKKRKLIFGSNFFLLYVPSAQTKELFPVVLNPFLSSFKSQTKYKNLLPTFPRLLHNWKRLYIELNWPKNFLKTIIVFVGLEFCWFYYVLFFALERPKEMWKKVINFVLLLWKENGIIKHDFFQNCSFLLYFYVFIPSCFVKPKEKIILVWSTT